MKTFILLMFFLVFVNELNSQISMVKDVPGFKEAIKGTGLTIVTSDTSMRRLYTQVFKNNWDYGAINFENTEDYKKNLTVDKFYLQSIKSVFVGYNEGGKNGIYYTKSFEYLTFYIASTSYVDDEKNNTQDRRRSLEQCIILPLEKKMIDGVRRYNFGILKNNLQQIKHCFDREEGSVYYGDFANNEKLAALKNQTLYIVVDDPTNVPFKGELADYPYDYKFVSNKELEDAVLYTNKEFHYMHFAYTPDKYQFQIGIINSRTGEEIFHDKTMNMSNGILISDRKIKFLVKKIEGK